MVLPLLKLGTLALKTISKPIAARLKAEAGLHPRFRQSIINIAQVLLDININAFYVFFMIDIMCDFLDSWIIFLNFCKLE